jgi:dipeptidyl aminopeptidase/acylaminoacyl peptidase
MKILLKRKFKMLRTIKNYKISGPNGRPIVYDFYFNLNRSKAPIIIFCHGYKGYKDWGAWTLFAKAFASQGIAFLKFNFSYNGGTAENPIDFPDLEAFGQNNYTKELQDLECVINWLTTKYDTNPALDTNTIILMGHSRGGGIVLIKASEDSRIKKVITLAGVSDYKIRFPEGEALKAWLASGVYYVKNGRTQQQMPHAYQFYEDFIAHEARLTISNSVSSLKIPYLIIHGAEDESVALSEAKALHSWSKHSTLCIISNANHVFSTKQPWTNPKIPLELEQVFAKTIDFINN